MLTINHVLHKGRKARRKPLLKKSHGKSHVQFATKPCKIHSKREEMLWSDKTKLNLSKLNTADQL